MNTICFSGLSYKTVYKSFNIFNEPLKYILSGERRLEFCTTKTKNKQTKQ